MRSTTATANSRRAFLDLAQWLLEAPMQQLVPAEAMPAQIRQIRTAPFDRQTLIVERYDWKQAATRLEDWRGLATASVEKNIFLEPAFALSAAQHFAPAHRPFFLFVSENTANGAASRLVGVFAFQQPDLASSVIAKLWCPPQMALGTPLINGRQGFAILDAVHQWFAEFYPMTRAILYRDLPSAGPLSALLRDHIHARTLHHCHFDSRTRAVLLNSGTAVERLKHFIGAKRDKEMRRLWRRLSEKGVLRVTTARTPAEIRSATEKFLALESRGWKGKRGTALLCDPSLATFMRTMARRFTTNAQMEIDAIELDGKPIAMGVIIRSADQAFYWKTTYDEQYAAYSPGVQVTWHLTQRLLADPSLACINSCALPNHPMIDHIWPDRIDMTDLLVSLPGHSERKFLGTASMEGAKRKMRLFAKKAYYKIKGGQPS